MEEERYQGALATANDSVYRYEGYIDVYLPDYRQPVGAVYAALSAVELPGLTKGNESTVNALKTADIVDQQFTMSDDIQKEIQNIYSTPYNYKINSTYYGTLNNMNTVNVDKHRALSYRLETRHSVECSNRHPVVSEADKYHTENTAAAEVLYFQAIREYGYRYSL